jgi:hypothetical protein
MNSTTRNDSLPSPQTHSRTGAIVGGVVGGLAGLAAIIGLAFYIRHHHATHPRDQASKSGALFVHEEHSFPRVEPFFDRAPAQAVGMQQVYTSLPSERRAMKLQRIRAEIDRGVGYHKRNGNRSSQDTPDLSTRSDFNTVSSPRDEATQDILAEQLAGLVLERIRREINEAPPGYGHDDI